MHNNLNISEMKQGLELQPFITFFHNQHPNCGWSCEKVTGSNVINVLKGDSGGRWAVPPGAKAFLFVTANRRSHLDSPFCVITQNRKFEFGHHHHRQSKNISNAQELTMQPSQTLSSAIAQIQKMHKKIGEKFVNLSAILRLMTEGSSS